jgi:hypothetical protein
VMRPIQSLRNGLTSCSMKSCSPSFSSSGLHRLYYEIGATMLEESFLKVQSAFVGSTLLSPIKTGWLRREG